MLTARQAAPIMFMILLFSSLSFSTNPTEVKARPLTNLDVQNGRANIPMAIPVDSNVNTESLSIDSPLGTVNNPEKNLVSSGSENPSSLATCNKLSVSSVSASGNDGNVPANVLDNNLNTRWSDNGVGSWIQLDLGSKKSICSVDVGWYRGNLRQNNFVISVSDNGNTFTNKFTGTSSGSTTSPEKYTLPAGTEGRYVRITVNGNTENNWASLTEIAVFGSSGSSGSCTKQLPTAISASNFWGPNSPSKAIDNNFDTRWANKGVGSWIQLDLGSTKNICSVDIAWFLGKVREFKFAISVSVSTDGTSFKNVRSGTSSGTTTAFEKYTLPAGTEARYIRITVNGNDVTTYGNAAEIAVFGSAGTLPPPPPPPGGGDAGTNDKFGIKKIYATKSGGEQWFMNMQDPSNDPRTSEPSMSRNSDGSWRVTSGQVRYGVFTSSGYLPDQVEKDHSVIASRGYMQSPNDWKNVEMTGQIKYNSGGDDEWTWYARGGRHTGSGWEDGCEGVALKGSLAYTGGQVRWAKEQWHVSYVFQPWKNSPADGDGKFVGFKVAIYNMQLNGKTVVKMESWIDPNNNNQWQKVYDFIDQGGWGNEGGECRGASDQIVTWGGPIASFRWDDGNSIDIKNLSVREIVQPSQ
ncbi:MAG: carbohydrate-binding protein [Nitrososphaeraceae archaeon]|nr:carbohydrate-binding protein [Nitrososphaeraceae archaeon]